MIVIASIGMFMTPSEKVKRKLINIQNSKICKEIPYNLVHSYLLSLNEQYENKCWEMHLLIFIWYHLLVIVILQGSSEIIHMGNKLEMEYTTYIDVGRYHCFAEYEKKEYYGSFNMIIDGKCQDFTHCIKKISKGGGI